MALGPKLVIPGTIFGCILVALFLFLVTAGITYPPPLPVQAANLEEPVALVATPGADTAIEEDVESLETEIDSLQGQISAGDGACRIGSRFPDRVRQWCDLIEHYADKRGLSPNLVASVILQESGGNEVAYSRSGAVGLMQVMPKDGLAANFMCVAGPCFQDRPSTEQLQDPEFNISYGTRMLASLLKRHGDIRDALRAYGPMDAGYSYADTVLSIDNRYQDRE